MGRSVFERQSARTRRGVRPVADALEARSSPGAGFASLSALPYAGEPEVRESHLAVRRHQVTGFVVTFTKDMDSRAFTDVGRFRVVVDGRAGTESVPLGGAVYDPGHRRLTLVPAQPVAPGRFAVEPSGGASTDFLTDTAGRPLDTTDRAFAHFTPSGSQPGQSFQRTYRQVQKNLQGLGGHGGVFGSIGRVINPLAYI